MSDFGRELEQSLSEALAIMDGKLEPAVVIHRVTPGYVADVCGLSASQMAARLGLDVGVYLEREETAVHLRGKALSPSSEDLLRLLVEQQGA